MTNNKLTAEQVQQLINATEHPLDAYNALKDGPRYDEKQQQQLVDQIAKSSQISSWALRDISWITADQRGRLKVVA